MPRCRCRRRRLETTATLIAAVLGLHFRPAAQSPAGAAPGEPAVIAPTDHNSPDRERSLVEMSDTDLARLFELSQPSDTSPEAGYSS